MSSALPYIIIITLQMKSDKNLVMMTLTFYLLAPHSCLSESTGLAIADFSD